MATKPGKLTVSGWDRFCRWLARAYRLDYRSEEVESSQGLNQRRGADLPAQPPVLPGPAGAALGAGAARLPAQQRARRRQPGASGRMSMVGQRNGIVFIRREFRDDHLYRAVLKRTWRYLIASTARTWSGTSRGVAPAPASCGPRATACSATWWTPTPSIRSTTSTSCRRRSSTTSSTRSARSRPRRWVAPRSPRASAGCTSSPSPSPAAWVGPTCGSVSRCRCVTR